MAQDQTLANTTRCAVPSSVRMEEDAAMEWTPFRLFTRESLFNIERRIAEEQAAKEAEKTAKESESESEDDGDETTHDHEPKPNPKLEAGRKLPPSLEDVPQAYIARPLEDLDEFYHNQKARLRKQFACVCCGESLSMVCVDTYGYKHI